MLQDQSIPSRPAPQDLNVSVVSTMRCVCCQATTGRACDAFQDSGRWRPQIANSFCVQCACPCFVQPDVTRLHGCLSMPCQCWLQATSQLVDDFRRYGIELLCCKGRSAGLQDKKQIFLQRATMQPLAPWDRLNVQNVELPCDLGVNSGHWHHSRMSSLVLLCHRPPAQQLLSLSSALRARLPDKHEDFYRHWCFR